MTDVVGHLLIFTIVGVGLLAGPLMLGRLIRPRKPNAQKNAVYECGEPTIGSSFVQFDLRFYVVALLFIIFDVEVVFFFPWTIVFGTAVQLSDPTLTEPARLALSQQLLSESPTLPAGTVLTPAQGLQLGWMAFADLLIFFAVLMVGFAYLWKRGDLDWVRAMAEQPSPGRTPLSEPDA